MINSPLRVYILCMLIYTACIYLLVQNNKASWGLTFLFIPSFTLFPAIVIEVMLTLVGDKIPRNIFYLISLVGILISTYGLFNFMNWKYNIKTEIHLPPNYTKDYIFVIYGVANQPEIKASMGMPRTTKINIPRDGFLLTSTTYMNPKLSMSNCQNIYDSEGQLLEKKVHPELLNKKIFPASNFSFKGQKYFIISIGDVFYNKLQGDSILQNEKFDFMQK